MNPGREGLRGSGSVGVGGRGTNPALDCRKMVCSSRERRAYPGHAAGAVDSTDQRLLENGEAVQCASQAAGRGVAAVMTRSGILHNHVPDVVGGDIVAARWRRMLVLLARDGRQAMLRAAQ